MKIRILSLHLSLPPSLRLSLSLSLLLSLLLLFPQPSKTQTPATPQCLPARPIQIDHWRGEYFNNREMGGAPVMVRDDGTGELNFDWGLGSPSKTCNVNVDEFSVRWTRIATFAGGSYRFSITSDDGVRLLIDGQEKFSRWENRTAATNIVDFPLAPGNHKIVLDYFENYGSAVVKLSWTQQPCFENVSQDNWRGEYFNNEALTGNPVMVRNDGDTALDFDWRDGSPGEGCGVKADRFSVRWSRKVVIGVGFYRFEVLSDTGARVFIDGKLQLDKWRSQGPINTYFDLHLDSGTHRLVFEYVSGVGRSGAGFSWKPVPCIDTVDPAHWRGEYFNGNSPAGQPIMVRDDGDSLREIDFNWAENSPSEACNLNRDGFSVRWSGSPILDKGVHRFSLTGYGGVRLSIDGQVKIDQWISKFQKHAFDLELEAGPHRIILEYVDFGGKASVKFSRQPPPCITNVAADHWRGEYFKNKNLSGRPSMIRDDGVRTIDFDWKLNTPSRDCLEITDAFSARWTRSVNFAAGTYRFTLTGDDGVRLFIDGKKLIDEWHDQNAPTYTADIELTNGPHRIVLEYYENFGSAIVKLSWTEAPCTASVPAENWKGEYFNEIDLSGKPLLVRDEGSGKLDFNWGLKGPDGNCGINIDNFSARFSRTITISEGLYRFTVTADDGVRVYIDRELKFDRWIDQTSTYNFDIQLSAGNHLVTVEYFERWGSAVLKFSWEQHPCFDAVAPDHWRGEYFNNTSISGQPVMVRDEGNNFLDFDYAAMRFKSQCDLRSDGFSARWSRKATMAAGLYRFKLNAGDGARLFVNGKKLIDTWEAARSQISNAEIYLRAGNHNIIVELNRTSGRPFAKLTWDVIGKALPLGQSRPFY